MKKVTKFLVATMLLCCAGQSLQAQTIKQHSGEGSKHTDYGNVSGKETYSYYIKDGEQVKHGNYTFNATGELNNPIYQDNIKFSITAAFKDGKFNGPCKATTTGTFHRYTIFNQRELIGSAKSQFSANFKEGELDGLLSITVRDLLADKYAEKWPITEQINIMFKNGKMVGQFDCKFATRSYGEGIQRIKGQFAENGSLTGKWLIEYLDEGQADNLRFVNSVLVDNGYMSDETIQIAEQFATGKLSEKDVEAKGYGVQTRKIYFSLAISHIAGIIDEFGLEEIREIESESRKYFIEERIPIEYKILVSVPFCTNEVFQLICEDTNYIKPKYDDKLLAYYVVYRTYDEQGFCDKRAYLTDSRLGEYTALKEERAKAKAGEFADYLRDLNEQYGWYATLFDLYKSGGDLKQIILKEYSDDSFDAFSRTDRGMVSFMEWFEKVRYNPGSTYLFDDRDGKIYAWKVDEYPEFKKFRLVFNRAYQELYEELDSIKSHVDWIEQNSKGTFYEISSSWKSRRLEPNNRYELPVKSLEYWRKWNRLYSLCKQRLANNDSIKVKFPDVPEKYKEDESIDNYGVRFDQMVTDEKFDDFIDYIENIVIVQNGYLRWDQLKNKVAENDTKIRSSYQKKTLKPYNSAYKAGMKAISKKPIITDQATADAECAPLVNLLKEQEQFMNSTTPDAQ